ncbi:MAG: hypothetical protein LKI03_06240 [Acetobacter indonesiensis]|jgi:hypothetical protein|nr:hypothetical protein [Acetobacter indonesiensis]MCI1546186.1 hypothetical protein [Acetobacter indonesiensis]MCI1765631.1 hypothetical protein [Acetobacter indonesiensis]
MTDKKPAPKPQTGRVATVMSKKPSAMAFDSAPAGLKAATTAGKPKPKDGK